MRHRVAAGSQSLMTVTETIAAPQQDFAAAEPQLN